MSLTNNDRKVQSDSGKTFPKEPRYDGFVVAIAAALKAEFGGSSAAIKSIGRVTHRNERAVRNWFEGKNSPSAENLVQLIQHSDVVLETVLRLADRRELSAASEVLRIKDQLKNLVRLLDEIQPPSDEGEH